MSEVDALYAPAVLGLLKELCRRQSDMSCELREGKCDGFGVEHMACWLCKVCGTHPHTKIQLDGSLMGVPCPHSLN